MNNISFEIISIAGDAFSECMLAIEYANESDFKKAKSGLARAKELVISVHKVHADLLTEFAQGKVMEPDILFIHALDHFTKAELMVIMTENIIRTNEKLSQL